MRIYSSPFPLSHSNLCFTLTVKYILPSPEPPNKVRKPNSTPSHIISKVQVRKGQRAKNTWGHGEGVAGKGIVWEYRKISVTRTHLYI